MSHLFPVTKHLRKKKQISEYGIHIALKHHFEFRPCLLTAQLAERLPPLANDPLLGAVQVVPHQNSLELVRLVGAGLPTNVEEVRTGGREAGQVLPPLRQHRHHCEQQCQGTYYKAAAQKHENPAMMAILPVNSFVACCACLFHLPLHIAELVNHRHTLGESKQWAMCCFFWATLSCCERCRLVLAQYQESC